MIEVGEYIRTKEGIIGIFQNIDEHCRHFGERLEDTIYIINTEKNEYLRLTDNDIKSHSKNIIVLVEVGDYINGERVTYKGKTKTGRTQIITEDSTDFFLKYEYIETILTHEQYEQNCYKIGE